MTTVDDNGSRQSDSHRKSILKKQQNCDSSPDLIPQSDQGSKGSLNASHKLVCTQFPFYIIIIKAQILSKSLRSFLPLDSANFWNINQFLWSRTHSNPFGEHYTIVIFCLSVCFQRAGTSALRLPARRWSPKMTWRTPVTSSMMLPPWVLHSFL